MISRAASISHIFSYHSTYLLQVYTYPFALYLFLYFYVLKITSILPPIPFQHHMYQFSFLPSIFVTPSLRVSNLASTILNIFTNSISPIPCCATFPCRHLPQLSEMPILHAKPFFPIVQTLLTITWTPLLNRCAFVQRKWYLFLLAESSPMLRPSAWKVGCISWISFLLIGLCAVCQVPNFLWQPC